MPYKPRKVVCFELDSPATWVTVNTLEIRIRLTLSKAQKPRPKLIGILHTICDDRPLRSHIVQHTPVYASISLPPNNEAPPNKKLKCQNIQGRKHEILERHT